MQIVGLSEPRFLLRKIYTVGFLERLEHFFLNIEVPLRALDECVNGIERFAGDLFPRFFLVFQIDGHQGVEKGLRVGGMGTARLNRVNSAFGRGGNAQIDRQRLAIVAAGDGDAVALGPQALQGKISEAIALEQFALGADKALDILGEHGALGKAELDGFPQASAGEVGGIGHFDGAGGNANARPRR